MAVKTLYPLATTPVTPNWWGNMQDGGTAPATATGWGWNLSKTSPPRYALLVAGATGTVSVTSDTLAGKTGPTVGTGSTAGGDSYVAGPYTGTFANTAWSFDWRLRCTTTTATGRIRMRVWKSANANGSSATELTSGAVVGSIVSLNATGTDFDSSISWSPGSITLSGEYLFFQLEFEVTTTGTTTGDNALVSTTATITTPDFSTTTATPIVLVRRRSIYLR